VVSLDLLVGFVHTKGGGIYPVPIPEEAFWLALGRLELEAQWREDDFLLYRQDTRRMRVDLNEAEEVLTIGREQIGSRRSLAGVTIASRQGNSPTAGGIAASSVQVLPQRGRQVA
jgi:hypothetical protein